MKVNLTPFSIYWFLFLILNVIYFIFPFLFFLLLPAVFVMILIWGICVFEIGRATIISSQTKRITRVILAFLASLLTISINPIGMILLDFINWRHINSFADYFSKAYWIIFLIHMHQKSCSNPVELRQHSLICCFRSCFDLIILK